MDKGKNISEQKFESKREERDTTAGESHLPTKKVGQESPEHKGGKRRRGALRITRGKGRGRCTFSRNET